MPAACRNTSVCRDGFQASDPYAYHDLPIKPASRSCAVNSSRVITLIHQYTHALGTAVQMTVLEKKQKGEVANIGNTDQGVEAGRSMVGVKVLLELDVERLSHRGTILIGQAGVSELAVEILEGEYEADSLSSFLMSERYSAEPVLAIVLVLGYPRPRPPWNTENRNVPLSPVALNVTLDSVSPPEGLPHEIRRIAHVRDYPDRPLM